MRLHDQPQGDLIRESAVMDNPEEVNRYLRPVMVDSPRWNPDSENMMVLLVNARRRVIGFEIVSNGTLDTILVHPREMFKAAIVLGAAAIVLAHNHPSGDPTPCEADIKVTRDLIRAGQLLKIAVLDHVILGTRTADRSKDYSSLRELGYFYN